MTTKIHALVDARGLPVRLMITPGQAHDAPPARDLLAHLKPDQIVLADKAYDAGWLRELIQEQGAVPNIPNRKGKSWNCCFSKTLYKRRNLVERFFNKLKYFRRVATRYDKLGSSFMAMIKLAAIRIWLRNYESTA